MPSFLDTALFLTAEYIFEGGTSAECDKFVRWIRRTAQKHGKWKEHDWTAQLVAMSLGGEALRWHSKLDPETADHWPTLLRALLDQYSDPK